jgi:hypothetical protein
VGVAEQLWVWDRGGDVGGVLDFSHVVTSIDVL